MAFIGFIEIVCLIYMAYAGIRWAINHTNHKSIHKYKWGFWISTAIFLIVVIASSESSNNQSSNHHSTHKAHETETYLGIKPDSKAGGETTFNNQGKATFNINVHKGTKVYFVNNGKDIEFKSYTHDGKNAQLSKFDSTHYRVIMKYDSNNDDGYRNTDYIAAKAKGHQILSAELDGDDNSLEKSQYKEKQKQIRAKKQQAKAKAKAKVKARKQAAKAKFLKKYPPIQQALGTTNLNGVDDTKLIETDASVTGDVIDFAHGESGEENVLVRLDNSNQLIMVQASRHKANSDTIEKDEQITAYGGQLTKGSITDMIVDEGISPDYFSDKAIFMNDPIKITTNSNVIYHGSHPSEMN